MSRRHPLFLLLFLIPSLALGQDESRETEKHVWALDLKTAIRLALEENRSITIAAYEKEIGKTAPMQAAGLFDEVLTAEGTVSQLRQPNFSLVPSQFTGLPQGLSVNQIDNMVLEVGLAKKFGWGLEGAVTLASTRRRTESSVALNPSYSPSVTVSVTQPLLRGFGLINEADIEKAELNVEILGEQVRQEAMITITDVIQAYWAFVFARENLKVARQALETATNLFETTQARFELEDVSELEVQVAETGVATRREAVIVSQSEVQNAKDALLLLIRPSQTPRDWNIDILPLDRPTHRPSDVDIERSLQLAIENRPELQQLDLTEKVDRLSLDQAEDSLYPQLDLFGSATWNGLGSNPDQGFDRLGSGQFYDLSIGIRFEWPLRSRAARGAVREAELRLRQNRIEEKQLIESIILEVRQAVRAVRTAEERIQATRLARELAERQLQAAQDRYEVGVGTTQDILEFEEDLTQARTNEISALVDYQNAQADLDRIQATTLERHDISLRNLDLLE